MSWAPESYTLQAYIILGTVILWPRLTKVKHFFSPSAQSWDQSAASENEFKQHWHYQTWFEMTVYFMPCFARPRWWWFPVLSVTWLSHFLPTHVSGHFSLGNSHCQYRVWFWKIYTSFPIIFIPVIEMLSNLKRGGQVLKLGIRIGLGVFLVCFYFTKINVCMGEIWRKFVGEFFNYLWV